MCIRDSNSGTGTIRKRIAGGTWETAVAIAHNTKVVLTGALVENAYEVEIRLTDTVGTVSTHVLTIRQAQFAFDFRNDRAALGRLAEGTKTFLLPEDWTSNIDADKLDGQHASAFASSVHQHAVGDLTSGTLSVVRGGTGVTTEAAIALKAYPVGAIYLSAVSTSPASLFGGIWEALGGRMLIGVNSTYTAGSTGGAATHTLTQAQLPDIYANPNVPRYGQVSYNNSGPIQTYMFYGVQGTAGYWVSGIDAKLGSGQAHNNMPPYLAVYMWKRTA